MRTGSGPWLAAVIGIMCVAAAEPAAAFGLRFSWTGIPACAQVSPAFELAGVPAATKEVRFMMSDLNVPGFHHGGSTITYRGEEVPRGAVRYIGPCPPRGERYRYRWTAQALDAGGKVLATATATAPFPP